MKSYFQGARKAADKLIENLLDQIPSFEKRSEKQIYGELRTQFSQKDGTLGYAGNLLKRASCLYPNDDAVLGLDRTLTFKQLYLRSVSFSKLLIEKGIKAGDRVILLSENSVSYYAMYFGIWQTGAVIVPLNVFLHEKELSFVINDSRPKAIVASTKMAEKLAKLAQQGLVKKLPKVLTEDLVDYQTPEGRLEVMHADFNVVQRPADELALLLYTSGTTGQPKGVMLSSKNIMTNALQSFARLTVTLSPRERFFCVLPLFHVFAQNVCIWLPMITGGSVVVVPQIDRKLIVQGLKKEPTIFVGVPALYGLLCLMKDAPVDSVKVFVSGADAMPDKIRSAFALIYGRKIGTGYGLTEASPVIAVNNENNDYATTVVGRPVCDLDCQIRDEDGTVLKAGKIGTLWVRGDNVMMGYYKSQKATDEVIQDGWLNTGDLASFDELGNLAICGRSKDLIIHKGFNIYPQEIENALMQHPDISKVAVIGKDDEAAGQIPVAYVAIKDARSATESELRGFCSNYLASYKVPRKFICLDDLPMNATGKVDKKRLQLPE